MAGYTFTDDVRRALEAAREEAAARRDLGVAPEHLLLGIMRQRDGDWGAVFKVLAVDPDALSQHMASTMTTPTVGQDTRRDFPYTSAAMRVLEFAMVESRNLGYAWIGAEHVLLGLVREESSPAAKILAAHQVTFQRLRDALARWTPPSGS